ncbi:MAG TPA: protein TolR [Sphingomonas sp.]|uniref:protein TolR n=1 Tax=Sphingomonas sp. TaxID=28214 RepID=UPI002ED8210C
MAMGPISGRGSKGRRAPMAEINVTPLVDVMLVLLIIFMVTAPLLTAGVPVELPDSRAGALEQEQEPLQLSLDGQGRIFIGETPVSDAALPDRLARAAADGAGKDPPQVFLRADRTLDYGRVMKVMGELNKAGLNKVALVTVGADTPAAAR